MNAGRTHGLLAFALSLLALAATAAPAAAQIPGQGPERGDPARGRVVVFDEPGFEGERLVVEKDWPGGRSWDRRIRSAKVPKGWRFVGWDGRDFTGERIVLEHHWSPTPGDPWSARIRSFRVERIGEVDDSGPPGAGDGIVIYDRPGFSGNRLAPEKDWAGGESWDRKIRSVRVPPGWSFVGWEGREYEGGRLLLTTDWSPATTDPWSGRIRSFRLFRPGSDLPDSDRIIIFSRPGWRGEDLALQKDWPGGESWDRRIQSVRVPRGWRFTGYSERRYSGEKFVLDRDWTARAGDRWAGRIRSFRIERTGSAGGTGSPGSWPPGVTTRVVIHDQPGFGGENLRVEKDWPGGDSWDRRIRSVRVPEGWRFIGYEEREYRGASIELRSDFPGEGWNAWGGRIRSFRVEWVGATGGEDPKGRWPWDVTTRVVIYDRPALLGGSLRVEDDWAGGESWDRRIRSVRVPEGWRFTGYEGRDFTGKRLVLNRDWSGGAGDPWDGRIRSFRVEWKGR